MCSPTSRFTVGKLIQRVVARRGPQQLPVAQRRAIARRQRRLLVGEHIKGVRTRQWVCSLPWRLRYAMGYDAKLCSAVLAEVIRALRRSLRRRAKLEPGLRSVEDAQFGALTLPELKTVPAF